MKVNNWLVVILLLIGFGVGAVSLYMASLSGVMAKMGLVGGDFSQAINQNELARQLRSKQDNVDCGTWKIAKGIPKYFLAIGEDRVEILREFGGVRITCGIEQVRDGNVERGVYTIIKGLYYLKNYYVSMHTMVEQDSKKCELLGEATHEDWIEAYLMASEGRVHEVVLNVYKQVERERAGVAELCSD